MIDGKKKDQMFAKLIASIIALQFSRITIDLDIGCFVFKNMFLSNYNIDIPKDMNDTIAHTKLVFKSVPISYIDKAPQTLKNGLKKNKDYGFVNLSPFQNIKKSIKEYILLS